MKKQILPLILLIMLGCKRQAEFYSNWPAKTTRYWIGAEYWANRLQDWRISNERLECINGHMPLRTVHLLTCESVAGDGDLNISVDVGKISSDLPAARNTFAGFLIGAGDIRSDYRRRALIHQEPVKDGGLMAVINGMGSLMLLDNSCDSTFPCILNCDTIHQFIWKKNKIRLTLNIKSKDGYANLRFTALDLQSMQKIDELTLDEIPDSMITGNIALVSHGGADAEGKSYWFTTWIAKGSKLFSNPSHTLGPVLAAQYTLNNHILKLTAQFPPIGEDDPRNVFLESSHKGAGQYKTMGKATIITPGWTATFRIENWDSRKDYDYRLRYTVRDEHNNKVSYIFKGIIRHDPVEKQEIVVVALTCNNNGGLQQLWFPHEEITARIEEINPDLLFFSGDQVYEGIPVAPDLSSIQNTMLDYLYKWYLWCWAYRNVTATRPCVTVPDDHDMYQSNLWGCGGMAAPAPPPDGRYPAHYKGSEVYWRQDQGGYLLPPDLVNMIQRTQTSHLPDPYNNLPAAQEIEVYFTALNLGRIGFAVLEDRKFKSSPAAAYPGVKIINGICAPGQNINLKQNDSGLHLLGDRQMQFIREWTADWTGTDFKVALMQSILACLQTGPGGLPASYTPKPCNTPPVSHQLIADLDAHGWPVSQRNKVLHELRKGFVFMIGGDQHLASIIHHGTDEWDDAGWSFCVPPVSTLFSRQWFPTDTGLNHIDTLPSYTGRYTDAFGNKINVWAVANPCSRGIAPAILHDLSPGLGVVRFNKKTQQITMECWPRHTSTDKDRQYEGWPKSIRLTDNYARTPYAYLPPINCEGLDRPPVIQVVNEKDHTIVYTLRMAEMKYTPPVFEPGNYTVIIGEPGTDRIKRLTQIRPVAEPTRNSLKVKF